MDWKLSNVSKTDGLAVTNFHMACLLIGALLCVFAWANAKILDFSETIEERHHHMSAQMSDKDLTALLFTVVSKL